MSDRKILMQLADPRIRPKLLYKPTSEVIYLIRNLAANLVHSKLKLSSEDRKKLGKFKKLIRKLALSKNKKEYKKYVKQSGGFLSILGPLLTQLALYGTSKLFQKAVGV